MKKAIASVAIEKIKSVAELGKASLHFLRDSKGSLYEKRKGVDKDNILAYSKSGLQEWNLEKSFETHVNHFDAVIRSRSAAAVSIQCAISKDWVEAAGGAHELDNQNNISMYQQAQLWAESWAGERAILGAWLDLNEHGDPVVELIVSPIRESRGKKVISVTKALAELKNRMDEKNERTALQMSWAQWARDNLDDSIECAEVKQPSVQSQIISILFSEKYKDGDSRVPFSRDDLFSICKKHDIEPLKNMGDGALYAYRYRQILPKYILDTQPDGKEWVILGCGVSKYEFRLVSKSNITPNENLLSIKIPESTPEIIKKYAFEDEQALLAKVRYNRLVDIFFGITTYSLQNHLRTQVKNVGQIEIDEIYVGVDKEGRHFIIPAQAKVDNDKIGYAQLQQDLMYCKERYPKLICRALAAKFMNGERIALFELTIDDDTVKIVQEKHYDLVQHGDISEKDLKSYNDRVAT